MNKTIFYDYYSYQRTIHVPEVVSVCDIAGVRCGTAVVGGGRVIQGTGKGEVDGLRGRTEINGFRLFVYRGRLSKCRWVARVCYPTQSCGRAVLRAGWSAVWRIEYVNLVCHDMFSYKSN